MMEGGCGVMSGEDAMDVEAACMEVEQSAPTEVACEAVQLARRVVTSFLRGHRAEDIVPANSRVVIVDGAVSLRHALRALLDNDVCAAPVIDVRTGEFVGVVSEADAVLAALQRLREEVSAGVAAATRALGKFEATAPLLGACRRLVGGEVGTVGIFADGGLLHTLEGSRVLRFVRTRVGSDAGLLGACVADLRVGTWSGVMTVAWDVSVREGLEVLARGGWGGVPVVEEGRVVDVLWRSDCLSGVPGTALELPLRGWLRGMRAARNGVVCDRNVSLGSVFEQMEKGRSRIFVEEDGNVVGVVTLRDVLRFFLD